MDAGKIGALIRRLRLERGLTQKQLAEGLYLSDKTVSKWERGLGCPDVSLLGELSRVFDVNLEKLLLGDLQPNRDDGGNMKRLQFYRCPCCGNILTATGKSDVSCCGRTLAPLEARKPDEAHTLHMEVVENDVYITFEHPMRKDHHLLFIACVTYDRVILVRLYPEQGGEVRVPQMFGATFYYGCSEHGLFSCGGTWGREQT